MTRPALSEALKDADLLHVRAELDKAIARMGRDIDAALAGEVPLYLSVMHGGLIFSGALALAISTDLEFDYVHATRYRGETHGGELHWLRKPASALAGRTVLLADDILDGLHVARGARLVHRRGCASRADRGDVPEAS